MDIHCLSYNTHSICVLNLSLDSNFEVEAGKLYNFNDKLWESLQDYLSDAITLNEFLDDVYDETGILPKHVISSDNFSQGFDYLSSREKEELEETVVSIGRKTNQLNLIPIDMCKYVL